MTDLISFDDINASINHEPRILDTVLAQRLGMSRLRAIKELIERNLTELQSYGEVCRMARQTSAQGGRPGVEYWLTEGQALLICALSRTPVAAQVRRALIEVFMAFRRRQIEADVAPRAPAPIHESALSAARTAAARAFADWAGLALEVEARLRQQGPDLDELSAALIAATEVLARLRK
ncbi:hypothetical protein [Zavarzinia aquatilis]|uniref:Rha family transcriptional regulator n=1 Tax=Zavarzinia aquatilis TaxID=2211142 RepID=A0A317EDF1_9PROT|nr:hypothetical protein [Zavarzinia aquatilis]PWR24949.1 hypothetical protein DKG74_04055 [Zavarzinia aquatilis]